MSQGDKNGDGNIYFTKFMLYWMLTVCACVMQNRNKFHFV